MFGVECPVWWLLVVPSPPAPSTPLKDLPSMKLAIEAVRVLQAHNNSVCERLKS